MKFVYTLLLYFIHLTAFAQFDWVNASIDRGVSSNSVSLWIQTQNAFDAGRCDNMVFTIRIPLSAGTGFTLTESFKAPAFQHLSFSLQPLTVTDGAWQYFLVNGTGNVQQAPGQTINPQSPFRVLELQFSGGSPGYVELVNLENNLPGNIYLRPQFYVQLNTGDITRYSSLFYGTGTAIAYNNMPPDGDDWVSTPGQIGLPLRFLQFDAWPRGKDAWLQWIITGAEPDSRPFRVERSLDGIQFETLATVPVQAGTSIYRFTDQNAGIFYKNQPIFYRISESSTQAQENQTEVKILRFDGNEASCILYPNPAVRTLSMKIESPVATNAAYRIMDSKGAVVLNGQFSLQSGFNQVSISVDALVSGTYQIQIIYGGTLITKTWIKQ